MLRNTIKMLAYGKRFMDKDTLLKISEEIEEMITLFDSTLKGMEIILPLFKSLKNDIQSVIDKNHIELTENYRYTSSDVRKILKVSPRTLQYYRSKGLIRFIKIGNKAMHFDYDVENFNQIVKKLKSEKKRKTDYEKFLKIREK